MQLKGSKTHTHLKDAFAGESRQGEVEAMPEKVNRSAFSDETAAKFFEDIIDRDQRFVKPLDVFLVVRTVLGVFGKGRFGRSFVRNGFNVRIDAKFGQVRENAAVKVGNGQSVVQSKILGTAIACVNL